MELSTCENQEGGSPLLSIIIDDFDSAKKGMDKPTIIESQQEPPPASIQKILEEAEHRKHEFWKLIEEHRAVVENLKKIEKKEIKPIYKIPLLGAVHK